MQEKTLSYFDFFCDCSTTFSSPASPANSASPFGWTFLLFFKWV
jgi:hypothetical protein